MSEAPRDDVDITQLLQRWRDGDDDARQRLLAHFYPIIRAIAQKEIAGSALQRRATIRATDLAHEAYMRLLDQRNPGLNRGHFLAIVARVVRRVAVDLLRNRLAEKRGAQVEFVVLDIADDAGAPSRDHELDLIALDQALQLLEKREPVAAQVMELRYFGGLTNEEVADYLEIGVATVVRHWQFGRAFLYRRLTVA